MTSNAIFVTRVGSHAGKAAARLLIDSIRTFGGEMRERPFWVFAAEPLLETCRELTGPGVQLLPLSVPETTRHYLFADKVYACARAEAAAPAGTESLIWIDPHCLVVQPPVLFDLGVQFDAALRPVHIRNVGLGASEPLDSFWEGVYSEVGVDDVRGTIESFVDRQLLRAYFNSHAFSVKPGLGLFARWYEHFERLVIDSKFQARACGDETHQVFLFQAVLSALVASFVDSRRVRMLPPTYNYPYNLQDRIPEETRASAMNDVVCFPYEDRSLRLEAMNDIQIREPLRSWLADRCRG